MHLHRSHFALQQQVSSTSPKTPAGRTGNGTDRAKALALQMNCEESLYRFHRKVHGCKNYLPGLLLRKIAPGECHDLSAFEKAVYTAHHPFPPS
jgi:hypothetical protein